MSKQKIIEGTVTEALGNRYFSVETEEGSVYTAYLSAKLAMYFQLNVGDKAQIQITEGDPSTRPKIIATTFDPDIRLEW